MKTINEWNAAGIAVCVAAWLALATTPTFAASNEYQALVLGDSPVLYYQFNEPSGDAVNHGSLGAGHNGVHNGTVTRGVSTLAGDTGVSFDSVGDFIESIGTAPAGLTGNPTFTAEAVVFLPTGGAGLTWAPFLHWGESIGSQANKTMKSVYFSISNDDPDEVFTGFYNGGLQTVDPVTTGRWHHVAWVRTGGGAANVGSTLYIDGVSVSLEDDPDLPSNDGTPVVTSTAFRVNRAQDLTRWFEGSIDELALYDRALEPGEVQAHFQSLPEPASLVLLLASGASLLARRRSPASGA